MTTTGLERPQPDLSPASVSAAVRTLLNTATHADGALLLALLELARTQRRRDVTWLVLALLHPALPVTRDLDRACRLLRVAGAEAVLDDERRRGAIEPGAQAPPLHDRLMIGATLVDVHHTATHRYRTGIQRVVVESLRRWVDGHPLRTMTWEKGTALRDLTVAEHEWVLGRPPVGQPRAALIPWDCRYVLTEIAADTPRAERLTCMAAAGVVRLSLIAYDLIPVTAAETAAPVMPSAFAGYLAVVAQADRVAAISEAAATEYRGFCAMLAGQGLAGPRVEEIALPAEAVEVDDAAVAATRVSLGLGDLPMVLAVGTHEPRKNHLALLQAAELLWRDGVEFVLVLFGHNGWGAAEFVARCDQLRADGRRLRLVTGGSDALLWASYRAARVVAFPSVHEGFGLPVAEALACGTPVVTSNIGSMAELAVDGGALTVDPHDDHALAAALRQVLTDDALHTRLSAEARARPLRTWDDYAAEAWDALVGPTP